MIACICGGWIEYLLVVVGLGFILRRFCKHKRKDGGFGMKQTTGATSAKPI